MTAADKAVRVAAVAAVLAVAAVAAGISYRHAVTVVTAHGEPGTVGHLYPVVIDGLIVAASLVLLDSARHREQPPRWRCGCSPRGSARPLPRTCSPDCRPASSARSWPPGPLPRSSAAMSC